MILLIDNYDSFVFNLARYVEELGFRSVVKRNDDITLDEITQLKPSHIIISPGPCTPTDAGISMDVVRFLGSFIPILGVCLGHQAIGQVYGCKVVKAKRPVHGKRSLVYHHADPLFRRLNNPLNVGRYHSLILSDENFSSVLSVLARDEKGEIMAVKHNHFPIWGVQFHPESVLTEQGHLLLRNFLD